MIAAPGRHAFCRGWWNGSGEICVRGDGGNLSGAQYAVADPRLGFPGACLGLDIRRVVETGITPLINTGIAHKEAGIGQIGAGTVRAPLACFELALRSAGWHGH